MNQCLSTYKIQEQTGFSIHARKRLFAGLSIEPILDFDAPVLMYDNQFEQNIRQISISGVQVKYSLKLEGKRLMLTETGGQYILKPVPVGAFLNLEHVPENEHLTMQIASRIFGIETAENTLIYFKNQVPAYLVKRFDIKDDDSKYLQEDFAQIKQVSKQQGENYKYQGSYEEIAELIKKHCGAWKIEIERLFKLVIFNYLFSNGDAHLKNFSLIENLYGDFRLSPAYDLLCTGLHTPNESAMALDLFADDYFTETYNVLGYFSYADFDAFGIKIGISENRTKKIIASFLTKTTAVETMIQNSFFDVKTKNTYLNLYKDRLRGLAYEIEHIFY